MKFFKFPIGFLSLLALLVVANAITSTAAFAQTPAEVEAEVEVEAGTAVIPDEKSVSENVTDLPENVNTPYTHTFTISAYYSPLPCQSRYVTGSYAGDIRLNGGGVRGADGSPVYPGMLAAPRTYTFGTKMEIPGVGIAAVHDRGGAIVSGNGTGRFDRLDVWMGYGDQGLKRALNWGKRTLDVVVYGVNENISEQIILAEYTPEEAISTSCGESLAANPVINEAGENHLVGVAPAEEESSEVFGPTVEKSLPADLKPGDSGEGVIALQKQLEKLNLYRGDITGNYGEVTKHAVFKFQQIQNIITDESSIYAGVFGPKTRDRMNELVASANYSQVLIANASKEYQTTYLASMEADMPRRKLLSFELKLGMRGPEVAELQKFLKEKGFFQGALITQYYGTVTHRAVLNFQKSNNVIKSEADSGAGSVGPATLELINVLS